MIIKNKTEQTRLDILDKFRTMNKSFVDLLIAGKTEEANIKEMEILAYLDEIVDYKAILERRKHE